MYSVLLFLYNINVFVLIFIFMLVLNLILIYTYAIIDKIPLKFSVTHIEYIWTLLPLFLTIFLTYLLTFNALVPVCLSTNFFVLASQWYWSSPVINLYNTPNITFIITSTDVLHGFSLPALGLKIDAIPGVLNSFTTFIPMSGSYFGYCTELCGVNHSLMPFTVINHFN